jgi:hypothetical protein
MRFPVQLAAGLVNLALLGMVDLLRPRLRPAGLAGGLALLASALVLLGASFFRADASPIWFGLRADAWGAGLASLAAAAVCIWAALTYHSIDRLA